MPLYLSTTAFVVYTRQLLQMIRIYESGVAIYDACFLSGIW